MGQRLCLRVDEMRQFGTWPEALWTPNPSGYWIQSIRKCLAHGFPWACHSLSDFADLQCCCLQEGEKLPVNYWKLLSFPVPGWGLNHKYIFVSCFTCFLLFQLVLQFYLEVPKKPLSSVWNDEEETFRVFNYSSNLKYFEKGVAKCKMIKFKRGKRQGERECNRTVGELERTGWLVGLFVYLKSSKTGTSMFWLHNISDLLVFIEGL